MTPWKEVFIVAAVILISWAITGRDSDREKSNELRDQINESSGSGADV